MSDTVARQRAEPYDASTGDAGRAGEQLARSSDALRRELGLTDLVLTQIVYVVGVIWVGTAARLGQSQVVFWLLAMVTFYLPQAAVVVYLSRRMPYEGGLYQWAKLGVGELVGFLVAWNLWMYAVVLIATIGLQVSTNISYAFGDRHTWIRESKTFILAMNVLLIGGITGLAIIGLKASKWVHNAGSVMLCAAFAVLIALPFVQSARGVIPPYRPFAVAMPAINLLSLNIFGKLAMGALSGFEYVAVLAGETRNPERTIGKATLIAAPIIAVMFILGTSSVLAFVPTNQIDLISPIPQVFSRGFAGAGAVAVIVPVTILLITARTITNNSIVFTGNTRMPMVAGWDRLLPAWFTRLDPQRRTPVNSILFVGLVSLIFSVAGIAGVGAQEAFQLLENAAGIFYGLTYLVMFAIPILALPALGERPPTWLRVVSTSGFLVTLLYVMLSIIPIIDVPNRWAFTLKISAVVVALNLIGAQLYFSARKRRVRQTVATVVS